MLPLAGDECYNSHKWPAREPIELSSSGRPLITIGRRVEKDYPLTCDRLLFLANTPPFAGLNDSAVAAYYSLMVESATILGADRREAEQQLLDVLQFETTLANVSVI